MKSIKPGRGPSAMGAIGSLVAVIFGIFWTIIAFFITKDSPFPVGGTIFPLFGVVFIAVGTIQAFYHYKNATNKERMSLLDIVDAEEEGDPLHQYFDEKTKGNNGGQKLFCPYCGRPAKEEFAFCAYCGKELSSI
ncbi:zinc ribbon domain-containing protein [Aneurinibacillus tyrosinisolvens]|uniref:zinc ribbon domain-containing protein n=1 Tax=Aneurinibacillus tyrosinisolvens TaxID=1443435 RepID=UPI00063F6434|nr:zinc ribbon domain-containing protein [Aneurinibacillus tyrosinisolvens]